MVTGGGGLETTENKIHWPRWLGSLIEDDLPYFPPFLMLLFVVCRDSAPLDDKLADRVKITSKGNLFTLSLTGCQPGDSGQYTCRSILYLRFKVNFLVKKSFQNLTNLKRGPGEW